MNGKRNIKIFQFVFHRLRQQGRSGDSGSNVTNIIKNVYNTPFVLAGPGTERGAYA
jgi:hypothetical protein